MVVARIGVAAVAIGRTAGEGLLVVSLNAADSTLDQQLGNTAGMRPERAEVPEEESGIGAAVVDVRQRRVQRLIVGVDATDQRESGHRRPSPGASRHPLPALRGEGNSREVPEGRMRGVTFCTTLPPPSTYDTLRNAAETTGVFRPAF